MKNIFSIILIAAGVGLFILYVDPVYEEIKTLRAEASQYNQALNQSKELQSLRDQLLSRYNTFSTSDIARLEKLLPDNVDNVRLILDIDNIASKYGMIIQNVSVNRKADDENPFLGKDDRVYGSITLDFAVSAGYENFRAFLRDIENSARLIDVVNLDFRVGSDDFSTYKFSIKTYWLK